MNINDYSDEEVFKRCIEAYMNLFAENFLYGGATQLCAEEFELLKAEVLKRMEK